jgi:hypothetical protein
MPLARKCSPLGTRTVSPHHHAETQSKEGSAAAGESKSKGPSMEGRMEHNTCTAKSNSQLLPLPLPTARTNQGDLVTQSPTWRPIHTTSNALQERCVTKHPRGGRRGAAAEHQYMPQTNSVQAQTFRRHHHGSTLFIHSLTNTNAVNRRAAVTHVAAVHGAHLGLPAQLISYTICCTGSVLGAQDAPFLSRVVLLSSHQSGCGWSAQRLWQNLTRYYLTAMLTSL